MSENLIINPVLSLLIVQVLSGKLMPSVTHGNDATSQIFKKNFLEAGGLKYVIDIFQNSTFSLNTNITIIQDCYVIALSLTKYLLCAPPSPSPDVLDVKIEEGIEMTEAKEPSSFSRQMSKTKSVEDAVARLTIEV